MVKDLHWDSEFFGFKVGQVQILKNDLFRWKEFQTKSLHYRLIYVFSEEEINEHSGLNWIEEKVVLHKKIATHLLVNSTISEFEVDGDSIIELEQLVYLSGVHSRFKVDPNFQESDFKRLYYAWMMKSIESDMVKLIVKKYKNQIVGFITLELGIQNTAKIGLIAVNSQMHRRGVAKELVQYSENLLSSLGYTILQVTTQSHNTSAMHFYDSCGFTVLSSNHIYHYWNL